MMKRLVLLCLVVVLLSGVALVYAKDPEFDGCTPGYWKQEQHFDSWPRYSPNTPFVVIFGVVPSDPEITTLLDALEAHGGGENALLRHAVAALLNAENWDAVFSVKNATFNALMSGDRDYIEGTKDGFVIINEGSCPFD